MLAALRSYFRGQQPYWQAYSLFAVHLALVLVASWCIVEWRPGAEPLRRVSLLLLTLAPSLWILWACSKNIPSPEPRRLARAGVIAAAAFIVFFAGSSWQ